MIVKVLLISPKPPPYGGIASWTENCLEYSRINAGKEIVLVHQNSALQKVKITRYTQIRFRLVYGVRQTIRILVNILSNIKIHRPDVIHLTSSASYALFKDVIIVLISKIKKIPVVVHWRFGRIPDLSKAKNWEWKLILYVSKNCHTSITVDIESYYAIRESGVKSVIDLPNPIGLDTERKGRILHSQASTCRIRGRVIFVGHVTKNKGIYELVKACVNCTLVKELVIVGPFEERLKNELQEIASVKPDGWLIFLGSLEKGEVLERMEQSQVLILPSYTEGFPNVIIEAMAMGCGIVASKVGAIPEILGCGSVNPRGICVPVRNLPELEHAISDLLSDRVKLDYMLSAAWAYVRNDLTMNVIFNKYKRIWKGAVTDKVFSK